VADWEDNQTDKANTRLPYASTLVQLDAPNANPDDMENFVMENTLIPTSWATRGLF
jgi:hypothetical protein